MKSETLFNQLQFNNILYIGEEPKTCLSIIEEFNERLLTIERNYSSWFNNRRVKNRPGHDKLQYHIHYHFEGGIAAFKFKNNDDLPAQIQNECIIACKSLVEEQLYLYQYA